MGVIMLLENYADIVKNLKKANKRLRDLEKVRKIKTTDGVELKSLQSYSKPYTDLEKLYKLENYKGLQKNERVTWKTSNGEIKFNTDIRALKKNPEVLESLTNKLETFLGSEESTVKGAKNIEKITGKSYKKFMENREKLKDDKTVRKYYNTYKNLTRQQYEDIFSSNLYEYLRSTKYDSEDASLLTLQVNQGKLDENKMREIIESTIKKGRLDVKTLQIAPMTVDLLEKKSKKKKKDNQFTKLKKGELLE